MAKRNKRKDVPIVTEVGTPPPFDDLLLAPAPNGTVSFTLIRDGLVAGVGTVTERVAYKAKIFLDVMFDGKVSRLHRQ